MKQWDIWTCDFADAGPHPAVAVRRSLHGEPPAGSATCETTDWAVCATLAGVVRPS